MRLIEKIQAKSHYIGFITGIVKIGMAIAAQSWLLFIHAIYNIIKACARRYSIQGRNGCDRTMFLSGLFVMAASIVYLIYAVYIYAFGSSSVYHKFVAIGIAAVTAYELSAAIYGLRKARTKNDIRQETIKYVNLASALISVSLTQTAILSFANSADMSRYYAVGDAVFGFLAMMVGVAMLVRAKRMEKAPCQLPIYRGICRH